METIGKYRLVTLLVAAALLVLANVAAKHPDLSLSAPVAAAHAPAVP